eukprot:scaffold137669_cov18-Tisochrysis_lutea.AAC.1
MTRYTWVRELSVNSDGCRDDNIIDALPDMPDPAMSGPQPFPAASALQNIRCAQQQGSLTSPCLILPLLEPQEGAEHHGRWGLLNRGHASIVCHFRTFRLHP